MWSLFNKLTSKKLLNREKSGINSFPPNDGFPISISFNLFPARLTPPELTLAHYDLEGERDRTFPTPGILSGLAGKEAALSEIVEHLVVM